MATNASSDSTSLELGCPPYTGAQIINSSPRHDTVKLAAGNFVQWQQHIHLITEGLPLDFDVVLTLASFSTETLTFQRLVDILVVVVVHCLKVMAVALGTYGDVSALNTTPIVASSGDAASGPRDLMFGENGWWSTRGAPTSLGGCGGLDIFSEPGRYVNHLAANPIACPYSVEIENFVVSFQYLARVSNPFLFPGNDVTGGHYNGSAPHGLHVKLSMPPLKENQIGPSSAGSYAFGCFGASRPYSSGHGVGPYSRPNNGDPIAGQNNRPNAPFVGPSANLVGLETTGNASIQHHGVQWRTKLRARVHDVDASPCVGLPRISNFNASDFVTISGSNAHNTALHKSTPYSGTSHLMGDGTPSKISYVGNSSFHTTRHPDPGIFTAGPHSDGLCYFSPVASATFVSSPFVLNTSLQPPGGGDDVFALWHCKIGHPSASVVKSSKSQAVECLLQFQKMIQTQFGKGIKRFQSDWGGEYRTFTKVLNAFAQANMPTDYWGYAFCSVIHLINRLPTLVLKGQSPYQVLHGRKPTYDHLRVFRCYYFSYLRPYTHHKLDFKSQPCTFLGYSSQHEGYYCLTPDRKVIVSRHVIFDKQQFLFSSSTTAPVDTSPTISMYVLLVKASVPCLDVTRVGTIDDVIPQPTFVSSPSNNHDFQPIKKNHDGTIARRKPRLVVKGCSQVSRCDFKETFSPVVKPTTIRTILAVIVSRGWLLRQVDVNNAFLNGDLTNEVFMQQPPGYVQTSLDGEQLVCRLTKDFYGLRQAPRAWFTKLKEFLVSTKFFASKSNASLFVRVAAEFVIYVLVYVDDIIVTRSATDSINSFVQLLHSEFSLKDMGDLNYFLGIDVTRFATGSLHLCQHKYIQDLLDKSSLTNVNSVYTPMVSSSTLSKDEGECLIDLTEYRSLAGALQYIVLTRPDIVYAINCACQFMHAPTSVHMVALKRILLYLHETLDYGLVFCPSDRLSLVGYANANWGLDFDDRWSTTGFCVYFGPAPISWCSKKQQVVSRSTAEAEYRNLVSTTNDITWLVSLLTKLQIQYADSSTVWCDNSSTVAVAANSVLHSKFKHVELDLFFAREKVADGSLGVGEIPACDQVVDIFTKPLSVSLFTRFHSSLRFLSLEKLGEC
ncbi:hypothetical protein CXB51_022114 [Gossypium anomalum]|uniref:Reverse transcriptase Ty1/copia-type domain-containing protein n=1 Tax=Gossypium anomalum TaxID=47600 RepID=A0A8J5Y6V2_9ROSI|nr:hypothetical protein CXB51_022114 [Gossypium anomalum]